MVRKYAVALEKLTNEDIPLKRRDGRQFSPEHYAVISHAKSLVDSNNGLNIETALRMALGTAQISPDALATTSSYANTLELTEALTAAVAKGNEALLAEVRGLRQDLLQSQTTTKLAPRVDSKQDELQGGLLVRAATQLEQWLKRLRA